MTSYTVRSLVAFVLVLTAGPFGIYLFVQGLRQRKVMTDSNLNVERDRNPVLFWAFQSCYAISGAVLVLLFARVFTDHHLYGSVVDKLIEVLSGILFLIGAILCCVCFAVGLRNGVAIVGMMAFDSPPSRDRRPIRFWLVQMLYVYCFVLLSGLGLGLIAVGVQK